MMLSNREKTLVIVLAIVVFAAIYIQFIFLPQWDRHSELKVEKNNLVQTINDINEYTDPQSDARKEIRNIEDDILNASDSYFPEINQETIILILSEMFNNSGINPSAAKFVEISKSVVESVIVAPIVPEDYPLRDLARSYRGVVVPGAVKNSSENPYTLEKMEIALQVQGTYAQIMSLINEMETFSRKIHISKVDMSVDQSGSLKCMMMIHIYGVPKVLDQDQDLAWSIFDLYGRDNPFSY